MTNLDQYFTPAQLQQLAAILDVYAGGKDESKQGKQEIYPVVLEGVVYWDAGSKQVENKIMFETGITEGQSKNFKGAKTYPGGFKGEVITILSCLFLPDIIFKPFVTDGTAEDAFNYFASGTHIKWKVGTTEVFPHPLDVALPFYSVRLPSGELATIDKPDDFVFRFPEPLVIPATDDLTVLVEVPGSLLTAVAGATNPHYPDLKSGELMALRMRAFGYGKKVA